MNKKIVWAGKDHHCYEEGGNNHLMLCSMCGFVMKAGDTKCDHPLYECGKCGDPVRPHAPCHCIEHLTEGQKLLLMP